MALNQNHFYNIFIGHTTNCVSLREQYKHLSLDGWLKTQLNPGLHYNFPGKILYFYYTLELIQ